MVVQEAGDHAAPEGEAVRADRAGLAHGPPSIAAQNLVYKLLGDNVETEISYQLPGLRIEETHGDRHSVVGLTAITPVTDETTEVHHMFWVSARWAALFVPIIRPFMHIFLGQDRASRRANAKAWCTVRG